MPARRRLMPMLLLLHMRLSKTAPSPCPLHTLPLPFHVALMQLTMSSRIHLHLPHPRHVCSASWASAASPTSLLSSFGCHAHTHILSQVAANGWRAKVDTTHPPAKAKQLLCRVQLLLQLQLQLHFDANQAGSSTLRANRDYAPIPSQVTPWRQNKRAKFSSQGVKRFVN